MEYYRGVFCALFAVLFCYFSFSEANCAVGTESICFEGFQ